MATVEVVQPKPVAPPKTYVLSLSQQEAVALRSFLGDAIQDEGYHPFKRRAPLMDGIWNALTVAGARYDPVRTNR